MRCPYCGGTESRVVDSRTAREGKAIRRRRQCESCSERFTTYEFVEATMADVEKRDGRVEAFDLEKLLRSMRLACQKRPVALARLGGFAEKLEAQIAARPGKTISSRELGDEVLAYLRATDPVAYVRYASVYRSFDSIEAFLRELASLEQVAAPEEPGVSAARERDAAFMRRALALAERGRGRTSPNPMVGAVLVQGEDTVVGEGFHPAAGQPHAEVFALRAAGDAARGATLYVTLEPCCHHGRTPPCTEAVIAAGVARVVVAATDPNPLVAGKGLAALAAAGVAVASGVEEAASRALNAAFERWIVARTPHVTLKLATSLDGRIAAASGASQWITGPALRRRVHRLRADADAVLVGAQTVRADDPRLTARDLEADAPPFSPPWRVVVTTDGRDLRPDAAIFDPIAPPGAIIATPLPTDAPELAALAALPAVRVLSVPDAATGASRVDLRALLAALGAGDPPVTSILCEGGGALAAELLAADLVDRLEWHLAPGVLGGDALAAVGPLGVPTPADMPRFALRDVARYGDDVALTLTRQQEAV